MNHRLTRTLFFAFVALTAGQAWALPGGISGYSGVNGSTCTNCHAGGSAPTVSLTGPATLTTGQSAAYTLTITGGPAAVGGFDVASSSNSALLTAGTGSRLTNGEVVHASPKAVSAGAVSWTFSVRAPSTAGSFTLFGAGLSANGTGGTSGDGVGSTSKLLTVTAVAPNQAPTVSITGPASGASFTAPANILINANAADADGTVAKVEFFNGTAKLGEDSSAPYSLSWNNVAQGNYALTARATDNLGLTRTSSSTSIAVMGIPPPPPPPVVVDAGVAPPVVDAGVAPPVVVDAGVKPPPPTGTVDAGNPTPGPVLADGGTCVQRHGRGKCRPPRGSRDGGSFGGRDDDDDDDDDDDREEREDDLSAPMVGCASVADAPALLFASLTLLGLALRRRGKQS